MLQNLSLGFLTKRDSNQSPQLQRIAGILKFRSYMSRYDTIELANNKGADQTAKWASWSAPLLFANTEERFSRVKAQIIIFLVLYVVGTQKNCLNETVL